MGQQMRMRVFAGPNGSGKSTIIHSVKNIVVNGKALDFGIYINADDIASQLRAGNFSFRQYGLEGISKADLVHASVASGLVLEGSPLYRNLLELDFSNDGSFIFEANLVEPFAQLLADFIRVKLFMAQRKFSFETVFSHPSKVDLMKKATEIGYKVYFYFVGTESPDINLFRVRSRVQKGGHDVPEDKVVSRYHRSMELITEASKCCYQAFFFDNSRDGQQPALFAHFKVVNHKRVWDPLDSSLVPQWFFRHYVDKQ